MPFHIIIVVGLLLTFSLGATIGAISLFRVMKKDDLISEINKSAKKPHGFCYKKLKLWIVCIRSSYGKD